MNNKFKVGDDIICINNNSNRFKITIGKKYKILYILYTEKMIYITDDSNRNQLFLSDRFLTLSEYRKQKLKKLCSK